VVVKIISIEKSIREVTKGFQDEKHKAEHYQVEKYFFRHCFNVANVRSQGRLMK